MRILLSAMFLSSALLQGRLAFADDVRYVAQPEQALAAFLSLTSSARSSIDLATFIFEPCHTSTQLLLDILKEKARKGVRVRILLDALEQDSEQEQILTDYFTKNGIQIRFYNRHEINLRLHIKLLVVDGQAFISGGRNISDSYFGLSHEDNYLDRDVWVNGASAKHAASSFNELWNAKAVSARTPAGTFHSWPEYCQEDFPSNTDQVASYLNAHSAQILAGMPNRTCSNVRFRTDAPDFADGKYGQSREGEEYMNPQRLARKRSSQVVLNYIQGAQRSLEMENWVYMPVGGLGQVLRDGRNRGLSIQVLTNADIEDGPKFFRQAMDYAQERYASHDSTRGQKVSLVSSRGGMSAAYELTPKDVPFFIHGKIAVRDLNDLLVGSFNLDSRSYSMNLESVVQIDNCPDVATDARIAFSALKKVYSDDLAYHRVPEKEEPSFWVKLFAMTTLVLY